MGIGTRMRVKLINEDKDAEDEVRVGAEAGVGAGADDGKKMNQQNLPRLDHTENKEAAIDDIVRGLTGSDDDSKTMFPDLSWLIGPSKENRKRFRPHGKNLLSAIKGILSANYLDGKPLLK
ncbi:hypothetical protein Tco_1533758 [Tanacetum coccineum]